MTRIWTLWLLLGGQQDDPKTLPFYILIGQSNSGWLGAAGLSAEEKAAYGGRIPNTEIWNPANGAYDAKWAPLEVGVNTRCENFADPTAFGPEASLFASLAQRKAGRRLLYKQGQGGTSLAVDWKPGSGARWGQFAEWLPKAVAQAVERGDRPELKGLIWMQGETDAENEAHAKAYGANLKAFMEAVDTLWRTLAERHKLPKGPYARVLGRINAPGFAHREFVRKAQEGWCKEARAVLIDTDAYPLDWVHYTPSGQIRFGLDIFKAAQFE
jgi:hypothetical protein